MPVGHKKKMLCLLAWHEFLEDGTVMPCRCGHERCLQIFPPLDNTAALTARRKPGLDDPGRPDLISAPLQLVHAGGPIRARRRQPYPLCRFHTGVFV